MRTDRRILTLALLQLTSTVYSQADSIRAAGIRRGDTYLSVLVGYNGWLSNYGEVGVAKNRLDVVGAHALGWALFASTEFKLSSKETVLGPKIGFWIGGGVSAVALGLTMIYYTNFEGGALRFRPEIGFGLHRFKLVYGYNIALTNKEFEGINTDNMSFVILLPVRKLKSSEK